MLPDFSGDGSWNMAIDEAMLDILPNCNYAGIARLYSWSEPFITLGRNQRQIPERWDGLRLGEDIPVVYRPTGGRAVLHLDELTLSLVFRTDHLGCGGGRRVRCLHGALLPISSSLLNELGICAAAASHGDAGSDHFDCFRKVTEADLVFANRHDKAAGAALIIRHEYVLQQVSLRAVKVQQMPGIARFRSIYKEDPTRPIFTLGECMAALESVLGKTYQVVRDWSLAKAVQEAASRHMYHAEGSNDPRS